MLPNAHFRPALFILFIFLSNPLLAQEHSLPAFERAKTQLERHPGSEDALRRVLDHSALTGGLKSLIAHYREKSKARSDNGRILLVLAQLERVDGNCKSAISHFQESAKLLRSSVTPYVGQALCHKSLNNWSLALAVLQEGLSLSSGESKAALLLDLAGTAIKAGRPQVAVATYKMLAKTAPRDLLLRGQYAQLLTRAGLMETAVKV
jgi:cytochrome c-type biogenesis protein CcmH/NrfG